MVKKEMGQEAVILRTRTISRGKRLGRSDKKIEVTAAVDYEAPVVTMSDNGGPGQGLWLQLEREIKEIKNAIFSVDASSTLMPEIHLNSELRDRYINFKTFGLRSEIIRDLMNDYRENDPNRKNASSRLLREALSKIVSRINIAEDRKDTKARKIYSFVGPTGVGKTTTLAKLAAISAVQRGQKAALITLDTFRIAAVAQLQTYAKIIGIPLEVATSSNDLQKAIHKHNNCDRIFIDTAGKNPHMNQDLIELRNLFRINETIHLYLVLSATTGYQNLKDIEKRFGALPFKSYIFTKLDETQETSTMINFLISQQKPISYLATGQQVPEDIEIASRKKLAALLLAGTKKNFGHSLNKGKSDGSGYGA